MMQDWRAMLQFEQAQARGSYCWKLESSWWGSETDSRAVFEECLFLLHGLYVDPPVPVPVPSAEALLSVADGRKGSSADDRLSGVFNDLLLEFQRRL
jgi:hypothetical protein